MGGRGQMTPLLMIVIATAMASSAEVAMAGHSNKLPPLNRHMFPSDFYFGASTAAYQYEGAAFKYGKGISIWDNFTHTYPHKIKDGSNGDVAVDFYHRYLEDIQLLKYLGVNSFRLSISWTRILPTGKLSGGINQAGVDFYKRVLKALNDNGITPFVTIFHWDLPQSLQDEYGGFLSPKIKEDFRDFADVCFQKFGDSVKYWITANEPWVYILVGYDFGANAPGRCSAWTNNDCPAGDSATEPYIVGHNLLLSHAASVHLYRDKYQATQKGKIGITMECTWYFPNSTKEEDKEASLRSLDFELGWFLNPITNGDYPKVMKEYVGARLPSFTAEESQTLIGTYDFLGLNYYTSCNVSNGAIPTPHPRASLDAKVIPSAYYVSPNGLRNLLIYIMKEYKNPTIYITEYGTGQTNITTVYQGVKDFSRINYFRSHLEAIRFALKENVQVKGSLAWSFLDDFEWSSGYTNKFGLFYIDFAKNLTRIPKYSAIWFKRFLSS